MSICGLCGTDLLSGNGCLPERKAEVAPFGPPGTAARRYAALRISAKLSRLLRAHWRGTPPALLRGVLPDMQRAASYLWMRWVNMSRGKPDPRTTTQRGLGNEHQKTAAARGGSVHARRPVRVLWTADVQQPAVARPGPPDVASTGRGRSGLWAFAPQVQPGRRRPSGQTRCGGSDWRKRRSRFRGDGRSGGPRRSPPGSRSRRRGPGRRSGRSHASDLGR